MVNDNNEKDTFSSSSPFLPPLQKLQLSPAGPGLSTKEHSNVQKKLSEELTSLTDNKPHPDFTTSPPGLGHGAGADHGGIFMDGELHHDMDDEMQHDAQEDHKGQVSIAEGAESDGKSSEEEKRSRDSGESKATAKSTVEDWFKDFNRAVQENNVYTGYDDDPPYYLPNSSVHREHHTPSLKQRRPHKFSRISPAGMILRGRRAGGDSSSRAATSLADGHPANPVGATVESNSDSNSDSYRSVIDDLTIKNQKLKRRLRRLEELQAEHLQTDKLFELRIHGLSPAKRQELESILQQFTANLRSSPTGSSGNSSGIMQNTPPNNASSSFNPSSIQTSDSAYASGLGLAASSSTRPSLSSSKSGDGTSANSGDNGKTSGSGSGNGHRKKDSPATSEKVKMKLVVRRLEQLFTGRQPKGLSAQISEDLLRNSQGTDNVISEGEGAREASLMDTKPGHSTVAGSSNDGLDELISPRSKSISELSADQRPTRPGDLDPRRAQIPEQNLEYLHNLTSSSSTREAANVDGQWDGWVYLNLITNLAQLHTINVTLPFVKKAISTMSQKLELSPDGKMVRWKGGKKGSKLSSDSGCRSDSNSGNDSSPLEGADESREKITDGSISFSSQTDDSINPQPSEGKLPQSMDSPLPSNPRPIPLQTAYDFHYKPLFAQPKVPNDDSSDLESSYSSSSLIKGSSSPDAAIGEISGERSRTRRTRTTGPIIYYENGNFCTDLSAQEVRTDGGTPDYPYERLTNEVVGLPSTDPGYQNLRSLVPSPPLLGTVVEGKISRGNGQSEGRGAEETDDDESCAIDFSPKLDSTLPDHAPLPVELEASGIGGVQPEDNFAINVQVKHYILPRSKHAHNINNRKLKTRLHGIVHRIPQSSIDVFMQDETGGPSTALPLGNGNGGASASPHDSSSTPSAIIPSPLPLRHELVSTRFIRLPPSPLPPASYMFFSPSSDESSRDSDGMVASTGSDYYMDSRTTDDSTDDGQDVHRGQYSRRITEDFLASSMAGSSRLSPSAALGPLISGKDKRLNTLLPDSSAATAGSGGGSVMEMDDDDAPARDYNDSDEFMDEYGLDGVDGSQEKSTDSDREESSEEQLEEINRPQLKRSRGSKGSVDSMLALRKT